MKPETDKETKFKGKGKPRMGVKREKDSKFSKGKIPDKPYRMGKNDPSWRCSDATMTKLVANLPFGNPAGLTQNIHDSITGIDHTFKQPGIIAVRTQVTLGTSTDYNSACNLAFRKIYSYVRHANSGSRNYEAADMGIYFTAIGQALALLGYLQRLLRTVNEFSVTNRYTPAALLRVNGVDANDIRNNQPQLKYLIAWLGRAIGSLAFPDMPYFRACYEAYKYIYRDNDSPKEQFYLLVPDNFGIYLPTYSANGGGVSYNNQVHSAPLWENPLSFADLRSYVLERMDVLLGDEDCGIMSGDILKAFAESGLFKPESFGLDYDLIQHSPEFLQQIHNLHPLANNLGRLKGYAQNPGNTGTAPYITHDFYQPETGELSGAHLTDKFFIDAFSRVPDPEEVVNCSVLNVQYDLEEDDMQGRFYAKIDTISFDILLPVKVALVTNIMASSNPIDITASIVRAGSNLTSALQISQMPMTNFDWHPVKMAIDATNAIVITGDLQNCRFFELDIGKRIHDNSMLSLFKFLDWNFYK